MPVEPPRLSATPGRSASRDAGPGGAQRVRWGRGAVVVVPLLVLGGFYLLDVPFCPSRQLFGIPCPGCGLTRASVALLSLDFGRALALHPLVPLALPLVVWTLARIVLGAAGLVRPGRGALERLPRWVWGVAVLVLVGVWAFRLAGGLGGLPDPVDPAQGLLGRLALAALG